MTKRINFISVLQGWAILCVVLGHAPLFALAKEHTSYSLAIYKAVYMFHMPLFFFISGMLFRLGRLSRGTSFLQNLKDKLFRLGCPLVTFTLLAFIAKSVFANEVDRAATLSMHNFLMAIVEPANGPLNEMWFIITLFCLFILHPIWKIPYKYSPIITALFLCLHFIPKEYITQIMGLRELCFYGIYFCIGVFMTKRESAKRNIFFLNLLLLVIATCGEILYITSTNVCGKLQTSLPGIAASCLLAYVLDRFLPRTFSSFRSYYYQIFLMGLFFQFGIKILYHHFTLPYLPMYLVCIAVGLYAPVGVARLFQKINNKFLNALIGL